MKNEHGQMQMTLKKELTAQDPWLKDWKRSISIEDFRKNCKNKLNKLFP